MDVSIFWIARLSTNMPKKKAVIAIEKPKTKKVKVEKENPVKISVESPDMEFETSTPTVETPSPNPTRVFFDGCEVVEILDDGKGNDKEYHCKMDNGTTMMVPKDLFLKEE